MKRITFIINSQEYIRNYIESGVVAEITKKFDITLLLKEGLDLPGRGIMNNVDTYKEDCESLRAKRRLYNFYTYKYKNRSSSFKFRITRFDRLDDKKICDDHQALRHLAYIKIISKRLTRKVKRFFFAILHPSIILKLTGAVTANKYLKESIERTKPDIVVLPSSAYAPEDIDFSLICKELNIPNLLIVDNWDNLSSKSILWEQPDFVAVWGEQSKNHAINIQRIDEKKIFLLGSARYTSYFLNRDKELTSHFNFPYILFVGSSLPFNEPLVLSILDHELSRNKQLYGHTKIVYRPHPSRQDGRRITMDSLKNVFVDPQVADVYFGEKPNASFQPALKYYPPLLKSSLFVIGGMTSMLIEAMIFRKPTIGLIHHEKGSITSPDEVFVAYEHFKGIENVSSIGLCSDLKNLGKMLEHNFRECNNFSYEQFEKDRNYFLYSGHIPYPQRLSNIINKIMLIHNL